MTSDFQVGRYLGQAASGFTKQAYVVKYLIRVGRQVKNTQKTSDVICECFPIYSQLQATKKKMHTMNLKFIEKRSPKTPVKPIIRGWDDGNAYLLSLDNNKKVNIDGAPFHSLQKITLVQTLHLNDLNNID